MIDSIVFHYPINIPYTKTYLSCLVFVCTSFRSPLHFVNIAAPLVPIFMLVFISIAESFPSYLPEFFVSISKRYNDFTMVRELTAVSIVLMIGLSNIIDMVSEYRYNACAFTHCLLAITTQPSLIAFLSA